MNFRRLCGKMFLRDEISGSGSAGHLQGDRFAVLAACMQVRADLLGIRAGRGRKVRRRSRNLDGIKTYLTMPAFL